ncbi:MAG: hypothetical protein WB566_07055 [Terriglobales bacterium]
MRRRRGPRYWPGEDARRSMSLNQWHIDVFKKGLAGYPLYAVGGFDKVVAGAAGLFAAQRVGEDKWFGELTGAHEEAGAVDSPWAF